MLNLLVQYDPSKVGIFKMTIKATNNISINSSKYLLCTQILRTFLHTYFCCKTTTKQLILEQFIVPSNLTLPFSLKDNSLMNVEALISSHTRAWAAETVSVTRAGHSREMCKN